MSSKPVEEVLWRINHLIKILREDDNPITLPLGCMDTDSGHAIVCSKGLWVTECDPRIAEEVLTEFDKRTKD